MSTFGHFWALCTFFGRSGHFWALRALLGTLGTLGAIIVRREICGPMQRSPTLYLGISYLLISVSPPRFNHKLRKRCKESLSEENIVPTWRHCTMIPLSTRSCLKSNKLRPILNGQFCHAISKNIGLNLFGSKQPREILVFVILKL